MTTLAFSPVHAPVAVPAIALRGRDGAVLDVPAQRWIEHAHPEDVGVLARATGPVLDVGCGPGRHTRWLHDAGIGVLGIDVSPEAVARARARGMRVQHRCVFDAVPRPGSWRTVLLLDGNIGIGGDPAVLLARCRDLLHPAGRILVELAQEGTAPDRVDARLELDGVPGPWFSFATVPVGALAALSGTAGLLVVDTWSDGGRAFAQLEPDAAA